MVKQEIPKPTEPSYTNYREFFSAMKAKKWTIEQILEEWKKIDQASKKKSAFDNLTVVRNKGAKENTNTTTDGGVNIGADQND